MLEFVGQTVPLVLLGLVTHEPLTQILPIGHKTAAHLFRQLPLEHYSPAWQSESVLQSPWDELLGFPSGVQAPSAIPMY
jgi:hypothetical protein